MSENAENGKTVASRSKSLLRVALILTILVHIVLFVVLATISWRNQNAGEENPQVASTSDPGSDDSSSGESGPTGDVEAKPEDAPLKDLEDWKQPLEDEVDASRQETEARDDDANTDALQQQGERIEKISNPENVEKMMAHLRNTFSLQSRATEPAKEPVAGSFDNDSAQIHDVLKHVSDEGEVSYEFVMLDREGRTMNVSVPRATAEPIHQKFEMLKKSPMLMSIYRGVVMQMLDKAINDENGEKDATSDSGSSTPIPGTGPEGQLSIPK